MRWLALAVVLFGCDGGEPVTVPPDSASTADVRPEAPPRDCSTLTTADLTGQATCSVIDCRILDGNTDCCLPTLDDVTVGHLSGGMDTAVPAAIIVPDAPLSTAYNTWCRATFQEQEIPTARRGGRCTLYLSCALLIPM